MPEKMILEEEESSFPMWTRFTTFLELTKPRALVMIIFTTLLAYFIAETGTFNWLHILNTTFGVGLAAAGSLALNQYMERDTDSKMQRTASRPLPSGRVSPGLVFTLGFCAMIFGYAYLWVFINPACSIATMICGLSYLYLYTPMKLRSSFSTLVGAIPGGMLPIMGWVAARNQLEIGAWILFAILFLWQIPHALIICIRHKEDYQRVGMKQLPLISKLSLSNRQMVYNIIILIPLSMAPYYFHMTENVYPVIALILGLSLLICSIHYRWSKSTSSAKYLFMALNAYLPLLLLAMYFDRPA